ncbi:MAG: DUF4474 domain-containing protein [Clostridia bacterium]|nr:DUF4474 domain-containing protein [Clostridia bacterium]
MTKHSLARRIVCTALIAVCIFASVTITSDDSAIGVSASVADASCRNTVSAETDEKTVVSTKKEDEPDDELDKRLATTHSAEVTFEELEAIIEVLKGNDPTEGKELSERGQNSKNNIAISLIYLLRNAKAVKDVRLVLEPYGDDENVKELCMYYKELFGKEEIKYRTTLIFDYNTEMIYTLDGTGILGIGFDFNFDFTEFKSSDDPWQRNFGFYEVYDYLAFLVGTAYDTARIKFSYDDRDWMIQIWKGLYNYYGMTGGEIGIYVKPQNRVAEYYDCASDEDRLVMSFDVYHGDELIIGCEPELKWWQTAFVKNKLVSPKKLTLKSSIVFPDKEMRNAFVESLKESYGDVMDVSVDGLTVNFIWHASK